LNFIVVGWGKKLTREGEITLIINNFDIDQIEIPEKTLVRFLEMIN
jgi:hypothetical protein